MTAMYNNYRRQKRKMTTPTRRRDNATKENKGQCTKEGNKSQCIQSQNDANTASRWTFISKNIVLRSTIMRNVSPPNGKLESNEIKRRQRYYWGRNGENRQKLPIL